MSKMRIYELAKELNVENKIVLDLCSTLGIDGKTSHSNAISDDEADKVRRHLLRAAVGDLDSEREVKIEGNVITEKRVSGNVIRRRKKDEVVSADEPVAVDAKKEVLEDAPEEGSLSHTSIDEKLKDALRSSKTEDVSVEDIESSDSGQLDNDSSLVALSSEESVDDSDTQVPLSGLDSSHVLMRSDDSEVENIDQLRKRLDVRAPKILGKIELPTRPVLSKRVVTKEVVKDATPGVDGATSVVEGDDSRLSGKKKGKKSSAADIEKDLRAEKRSKRKQVLSKGDLLDYDGEKDFYKSRKDRKNKKSKQDPLSAEAIAARAGRRPIKIDGEITVGEMAHQMSLKSSQLISELMKLGNMSSINQLLDFDTATLVAESFGFETQNTERSIEDMFVEFNREDDPALCVLRPPVVTVMGHVDHGKTSLLDAIRKTTVTDSEAGGITQHIGAYNVKLPAGGSVTFLDTPGHEAFTSMRSRGAQVTDIVVLVVAADDGVMPQTAEAINHAKAAGVPIIVAINKMDKEGANPDKVINQLSEHGLVPEEWGGDTLMVKLSAMTGDGVDTLLETLNLQSEILELKANPDRPAMGSIIESKIDKGRGPVLTVLVQKGTLKKGDIFVSGSVFGKVRALISDDGKMLDEVGPSIPVGIVGASATADAGDDFTVTGDESQAKFIAEEREQRKKKKELASASVSAGMGMPLTMERFSEILTTTAEKKDLPIVVKVDVQGSLDAMIGSLMNLSNEEIQIKIIHKAVGAVTENDVQLAGASKAILVAFNVRPDARALQVIENEGVPVLQSRVIYEIVDAVKDALQGRMAPKFQEKILGRVEVRQTFKVPKEGTVAGSYVLDGTISRNAKVRLLRDGIIVHEGKMSSLRRFKDDVKEVQAGYECGIGIDGYSDIKDGDIIEVFKVEEVRPTAH
jgi:translation initiation factor IF-2